MAEHSKGLLTPITVPESLKAFRNPDLLYIRVMDKYSSRSKRQKRVVVMTKKNFILCEQKTGAVKRFFNTSDVIGVEYQDIPKGQRHMVVKIRGEHDLALIQIEDKRNPPGSHPLDDEFLQKIKAIVEDIRPDSTLPILKIPVEERDILLDADNTRRPGYDEKRDRMLGMIQEAARRKKQEDAAAARPFEERPAEAMSDMPPEQATPEVYPADETVDVPLPPEPAPAHPIPTEEAPASVYSSGQPAAGGISPQQQSSPRRSVLISSPPPRHPSRGSGSSTPLSLPVQSSRRSIDPQLMAQLMAQHEQMAKLHDMMMQNQGDLARQQEVLQEFRNREPTVIASPPPDDGRIEGIERQLNELGRIVGEMHQKMLEGYQIQRESNERLNDIINAPRQAPPPPPPQHTPIQPARTPPVKHLTPRQPSLDSFAPPVFSYRTRTPPAPHSASPPPPPPPPPPQQLPPPPNPSGEVVVPMSPPPLLDPAYSVPPEVKVAPPVLIPPGKYIGPFPPNADVKVTQDPNTNAIEVREASPGREPPALPDEERRIEPQIEEFLRRITHLPPPPPPAPRSPPPRQPHDDSPPIRSPGTASRSVPHRPAPPPDPTPTSPENCALLNPSSLPYSSMAPAIIGAPLPPMQLPLDSALFRAQYATLQAKAAAVVDSMLSRKVAAEGTPQPIRQPAPRASWGGEAAVTKQERQSQSPPSGGHDGGADGKRFVKDELESLSNYMRQSQASLRNSFQQSAVEPSPQHHSQPRHDTHARSQQQDIQSVATQLTNSLANIYLAHQSMDLARKLAAMSEDALIDVLKVFAPRYSTHQLRSEWRDIIGVYQIQAAKMLGAGSNATTTAPPAPSVSPTL